MRNSKARDRSFSKPFTDADVRALLAQLAVPLPRAKVLGVIESRVPGASRKGKISRAVALRQWLNNVLRVAEGTRRKALRTNPSDLSADLFKILKVADNFRKALTLSANAGHEEFFRMDRALSDALERARIAEKIDPQWLWRLIELVALLERCARWAISDIEQAKIPAIRREKRNAGDTDLDALFHGLSVVWREIWKRRAFRDQRDPFATFCKLVLSHCGVAIDKRQLRNRLAKVSLPAE